MNPGRCIWIQILELTLCQDGNFLNFSAISFASTFPNNHRTCQIIYIIGMWQCQKLWIQPNQLVTSHCLEFKFWIKFHSVLMDIPSRVCKTFFALWPVRCYNINGDCINGCFSLCSKLKKKERNFLKFYSLVIKFFSSK